MKRISYAIQIDNKFVAFTWNDRMEWEDLFKEDLEESNITDILFDTYEEALLRMNKLIEELHEVYRVDEISFDDIESMKIVKLEITFDYKVLN